MKRHLCKNLHVQESSNLVWPSSDWRLCYETYSHRATRVGLNSLCYRGVKSVLFSAPVPLCQSQPLLLSLCISQSLILPLWVSGLDTTLILPFVCFCSCTSSCRGLNCLLPQPVYPHQSQGLKFSLSDPIIDCAQVSGPFQAVCQSLPPFLLQCVWLHRFQLSCFNFSSQLCVSCIFCLWPLFVIWSPL